MTRWIKVAAAAISALAVAVLAYALLTPEPQSDTTDHGGMMNGRMTYSSTKVGLVVVSLTALVISLMVIILWQEYEPLPPSMRPSHMERTASDTTGQSGLKAGESAHVGPEAEAVTTDTKEDRAARNYLILRLLTGDERTMFKALMDSNGHALQKDLVLSTKMSNAKVSRVLDRLVQKGVVTKERYGSTNMIKIKPES